MSSTPSQPFCGTMVRLGAGIAVFLAAPLSIAQVNATGTFSGRALNRANFGLPDGSIGSSAAGTINTVIKNARQIQFALRFHW